VTPYDPFAFGAPPEDALVDEDVFTAAYQPQPDNEFLMDNMDLPHDQDANPFKGLDGVQKFSEGHPMMSGMVGEGAPMMGESMMGATPSPLDEEALQQALLDASAEENANAASYQEGVVSTNEEDERQMMKNRMGEM